MKRTVQTIVGQNLTALMKAHGTNPKKLALRISPSKSTIERIAAGGGAAQLDTLAELAKFFELQPWQMLIPDLDPKNPPMLRHEDEKLKKLYASLEVVKDVISEYEKGEPNK